MSVCSHGLSAFLCSGFFGEPDSFSMYGSNRVKRRPSPYEMEITDGERISPLRRLLEGEGGGVAPFAEGDKFLRSATLWD